MTDSNSNPEFSEGDRLFVGKVIPIHTDDNGSMNFRHLPVLYLEITGVTNTGYRVKHVSPTGENIRTLLIDHEDVESAEWATYTEKSITDLQDSWGRGQTAV